MDGRPGIFQKRSAAEFLLGSHSGEAMGCWGLKGWPGNSWQARSPNRQKWHLIGFGYSGRYGGKGRTTTELGGGQQG